MEERILVKPQMEEYDNFEVFNQEKTSTDWATVVGVVCSCASIISLLIQLFGC